MSKMESMQFETAEIVQIAKWQRVFIYLFLGILMTAVLSGLIPLERNAVNIAVVSAVLIARIIMSLSAVIVLYRLAKALRRKAAVLYAFPGTIIPLVNLLIIISLISQATKVLKARGLKVGLLGCKSTDLPQ